MCEDNQVASTAGLENEDMVQTPTNAIFISYRRQDSAISTHWLAESLRLAFGADCVFVDTDSIRIGTDWKVRISEGLNSARVVVVVIGGHWLRLQDDVGRRRLDKDDDWVRGEIRHALNNNLKIIPVLVDGADVPPVGALPADIEELIARQAVRIRNDAWESDREIVFRAIEDIGLLRAHETVEYPPPCVRPHALSADELAESLKRSPGWQLVKRPNKRARDGSATELFQQFAFNSFEDAIHFMATAARRITHFEHHPDWRNLWRTVSVWLTTWDIGHQPSKKDFDLAEYLDRLYREYQSDDALRKESKDTE